MTSQPHAAAAAPADVQTAFKLWIADIIVGLVAGLLTFLIFDELIELSGAQLPPEASGPDAEAILAAAVTFGIIIGLAILALTLLFIFKMRAGRNWARIVLTVLGAIGLIGGLIGIGDTLALFGVGIIGAIVALLSLAQLVIIAAAIYYMFRPAASAYFAGR